MMTFTPYTFHKEVILHIMNSKGSRRQAISIDEFGRVVSNSIFNNGHVEEGVTYFYHSNGKISMVDYFKNGKLTTSILYDEKGHKISTEEY